MASFQEINRKNSQSTSRKLDRKKASQVSLTNAKLLIGAFCARLA